MRKHFPSIAVGAVLVFYFFPVASRAQDTLTGMLKGVYGFTQTMTCVGAEPIEIGVYPGMPHFQEVASQTFALTVDGELSTIVFAGTATFAGDGTYSEVSSASMTTYHSRIAAGEVPVPPEPPLACEGTYTVDVNRKIDASLTCTQTMPGEPPLTATLGVLEMVGYLGTDPRMVVLSAAKPKVLDAQMSLPDGTVVGGYQGMCSASQVLIRIDNDPLIFAQFANGEGFTSEIVLANPSTTSTASGTVSSKDDNGEPMPIGVLGESGTSASMDFTVPSLGATTITTDGQGTLSVGSAIATANAEIGGVVRFSLPGVGITGVGSSQAYTGFILPVQRKAGGISTGLAVHNSSSVAVKLNLSLRGEDGSEVGTATIDNMPAGGHVAKFVNELFPGVDTDDFRGTIVVEVDGGSVAATALELDAAAGTFTTLPVMPLM